MSLLSFIFYVCMTVFADLKISTRPSTKAQPVGAPTLGAATVRAEASAFLFLF